MSASASADSSRKIRSVVIVGGGSAGWMTAAALANYLQKDCKITLIESDEIGIVGVGEATIPPIKVFNQGLGIDENEMLKRTKGTFKLGIQFVDWAKQGHNYFHPFGTYGRPFDLVNFHHYWIDAHKRGLAGNLDDYCMAWAAVSRGKFNRPAPDERNVLSTYEYAYHFDASLYGRYLREYSEARGVARLEGKIVAVHQNGLSGFVESVQMENGNLVEGDLFVDCSGFRALLIEGALKTGYEDWSHWLPCDRALAVPCELGDPTPYTQSTAKSAGWQWRIPLQHRTGNGHVYCSSYISDDEAAQTLLAGLDTPPLGDPRPVRFLAGRRKQTWSKNVVSIGLSSGFLEPLESTSLHLIQAGISKLLAFFPNRDFDPLGIDEFNRVAYGEVERIRDFIILHYCLTTRDDSELWRYCANMSIPETLQLKIDHFRRQGRLLIRELDLFGNASWLAVQIGQFNFPERLDAIMDYRTVDAVGYLAKLRTAMAAAGEAMPTHQAYIDRFCKASTP